MDESRAPVRPSAVRLVRQLRVPRLAPIQPAEGPLHALARGRGRRLARHDVVEGHRDIGAQLPLDLHGALRRQRAAGAIDVALELHPVLGDAAKALEGEHLKATRVGQHRPVPGGKPMQPTHLLDHLFAGPEMQVVGVAQNDLGAGAADIVGAETPHDGVGPHRHERRRLDLAVRQRERAGSGRASGALNPKFKHQVSRIIPVPRRSRGCGRSGAGEPGRGPP